jgi:nucleoside-diphosphate-sugar epimerase
MASDDRQIVLITGSSGLIGAAVVRRLAEEFTVIGFDKDGNPYPPPQAECVCVDLTSDKSVRDGFERVQYAYGRRISSVIHLAAYYDFSGEPSPLYEEITVRGTERMLDALKAFEVEQFVFSSTMLVHAPAEPGQKIDEDWPLLPKWDYPKSKVRTEELIRAERGTIPVALLRIAGVYDDRCHSIPLAHQIHRIYERKLTSHVFPGDTSRGQAFLHLDDLVEALQLVVRHRKELPPQLVLLLGEPETLSYEELQRSLGRLIHGEEWETKQIPKALAKAGAWMQDTVPGEEPFIKPWMIDLADDHYELDITRARTILGWKPKRSLRETLPKMVAALKADPAPWYRENKLEPSASMEGGTQKEETPREQAHGGGAPAHHAKKAGAKKSGDHLAMVRAMREKWLWTNFTVAALGLWLMTSPFTFGYGKPAMIWSDVASGAALLVFSLLAVWPRFDFAGRWTVALVGTYLQFAPILFWAENPAAYVNDTLVGAFAIALSILVPMMPGMAHHMVMMKPGPEVPPGWTYNPSSWHQRAPMIALGLLGWFISRYLAAVQLGYLPAAWEPFFGEGTARVLHSEVSRMWPISDAGLGAFAYTFETLMAFMGGKTRWRTMPWMVTFFGILVIPLGLTHIVLVILQPVVVGSWCTLCLTAATLMLLMIPLTVDEVVAMCQFVKKKMRAGESFWRTFWVGGTLAEKGEDARTPRYGAPALRALPAMFWGVTAPWTLLASAAGGVWLMFSPAVFDTSGRAANSDHLVGALVVTIAFVAMAEVTRVVRFANVLAGSWVAAAPWLLGGFVGAARWNGVVTGLALLLVSLPRGKVREKYGRWDRMVV